MLLIENIGSLLTMLPNKHSDVGEIKEAAILVEGDHIFWCGEQTNLPACKVEQKINAQEKLVLPGLIDCHTHLLFAGSRAHEFALRMNSDNHTYQSIMTKGGGIASTVKATREESDESLQSLALKRLDAMLLSGITTIEAKSGYGLSVKDEIRILELLKALNKQHPVDIHSTCLAAHLIPPEFASMPDKYVELVIDLLPQVRSENLAIDCDVFCEIGAFSYEQSLRVLTKAHDLGFGLRAHVHQLSESAGGVRLVTELPLKSISHADFLNERDIALIKKTNTVVEALPFAALFLRSKTITPVARLKEASINLAIATDFNPGSAMCHDLVLAARLGLSYFGFTINDAIAAITSNAAKALGRSDIGQLKPGAKADILISTCNSIDDFFYDWSKNPVAQVIKNGFQVF